MLVGVVAGTAAVLYLTVARDLPAYTDGVRVPWWALAAAFAVTEVFVIHAHFRGSAHTLSLSELPLVAGLLLAAPQDLIVAQVAGPLLVLLFVRGRSPAKVAFNLAQFALTATLAVIVLHAIVPAPATIGPAVWSATFAAVLAGSLVAAALVLCVIALSEGAMPSPRMLRMYGIDLVVALTNTSIGLAGATLIAEDWTAGWLIIPPAAVLVLAYRAYLSEHTKHQALEFLYGVARSLSRAPDIESALVDLLSRTHESFRVRRAEIVLFGAPGDLPLRTSLDLEGATQTMQPLPHAVAGALRACLTDERAAVVIGRGEAPAALAMYMDEHGLRELAVAPVPGETRLVGVMLLGDRIGALGLLQHVGAAAVRDARRPRRACRSSSTGSSRRSGGCASCRARSSARPTATRSPTSPTARCSCAACTSRSRAPRRHERPSSSSTSTTSSGSTTTRATPPATRC